MRLIVTGDGVLAQTVRACCQHDGHGPSILWICHDTPLFSNNAPAMGILLERIQRDVADYAGWDACVVLSSQVPVGTMRQLETEYPGVHWAYVPENIRVAHAEADFLHQSRIVIGTRHAGVVEWLTVLLCPFTQHIISTDPETAEMVKSALNGFLALNIAYINEIAALCAKVGANPVTVAEALRLDERISLKAPLAPGPPFGGGHLARELYNLNQIAQQHQVSVPIIEHIQESNDIRKS